MRLLPLVLIITLVSLSLSAGTDPCVISKHSNDIIQEWKAPILKSNALQSFISDVQSLALRSQKYCSTVQKSEAHGEYKSVARRAIKTISASIKRLNGLKGQAKAELDPDSYRSILENTIKEMGQFLGAGHVVVPGHGIIPVFPPPPKNPINSCTGAGDDVADDCREALETLEECGAISAGQAVIGQMTCSNAGRQEENACNLANLMGEVYSPPRTDMNAEAQGACSDIDEERTRDLNQKEGVGGR